MIVLPLLLVSFGLAAWLGVPLAAAGSYVFVLRRERWRRRRRERLLPFAIGGWAVWTLVATVPIALLLVGMAVEPDAWEGPTVTAIVLSAPVATAAAIVLGEWRLARVRERDG